MTPSLDLLHIKPGPGGKRDSFEDLVCSIAQHEATQINSPFFRVRGAGGDGGLECYYIMRDKKMTAWQAKFFTGPMGRAQWDQLRKSIATALKTYPTISRYIIALSIDFTGKTTRGVGDWEKWLQLRSKFNRIIKNRRIKLDVITASDLANRIITIDGVKPGYIQYWFGINTDGETWREANNIEIHTAFNACYDPLLVVQTDISRLLDAVCTNPAWITNIGRSIVKETSNLVLACRRGIALCDSLANLNCLHKMASAITEKVSLRAYLYGVDLHADLTALEDAFTRTIRNLSYKPEVTKYNIERLNSELRDGIDRIRQLIISLSWTKAHRDDELLTCIVGRAGTGKTHNLVHVARQSADGTDTGLILLACGKNIQGRGQERLEAIARSVGFTSGWRALVTSMECDAIVRGKESLLIIDALNESADYHEWNETIPYIYEQFRRASKLRLVISLRPEFAESILRKEFIDKHKEAVIVHPGFSHTRDEALNAYSSHYHVERPIGPSIYDLAENPLMLKLFCQSRQGGQILSENGNQGAFGLPRLIDEWLDYLDQTAAPKRLSVDPRSRMVHKSVDAIVINMISLGRTMIPYDQATDILRHIHHHHNFNQSGLCFLLDEGVLSCTRGQHGDSETYISFAFERLTEWAISSHFIQLLKKPNRNLARLKKHIISIFCPANRSINCKKKTLSVPSALSQLIVMFADVFGVEITSIIAFKNYFREHPEMLDTCISEGVLWRSNHATTNDYREWIISKLDIPDLFVADRVIRASCIYQHALSARRWLHPKLKAMSLMERDANWTTTIGWLYEPRRRFDYSYKEIEAFDSRLATNAYTDIINWISSENNLQSNIDRQSLIECALILSWSLGSSHRFLRDRATHALTRIIQRAPEICGILLEEFNQCNDPYITERVLAAIYGASLRGNIVCLSMFYEFISTHPHAFENISNDIVIFDYVHSLLEACVHFKVSSNNHIEFRQSRSKVAIQPGVNKADSDSIASSIGDASGAYESSLARIRDSLFSVSGDFGHYCLYEATEFSRAGSVSEATISQDEVKIALYRYIASIWPKNGTLRTKLDRYDRSWPSPGRTDHKAERLGKKHQWLAYRDLLSALYTNYDRRSGYRDKIPAGTLRPWDIEMRQFDPCIDSTATDTELSETASGVNHAWWESIHIPPSALRSKASGDSWMKHAGKCLLNPWTASVCAISDNTEWIVLQQEKTDCGERLETDLMSRERAPTCVSSFMVDKKKASLAIDVLAQRSFMNRDLFSPNHFLGASLGEWPWHPRFHGTGEPYIQSLNQWENDTAKQVNGERTCVEFVFEPGYDCSRDDTLRVIVPSQFLFKNDLSWNGNPGEYVIDNKVVFCDPSLRLGHGPKSLIVSRDYLQHALHSQGKCLISVGIVEWFHHLADSAHNDQNNEVAWGVTCLASCTLSTGKSFGYAQHYALMVGNSERLIESVRWEKSATTYRKRKVKAGSTIGALR